MEKLKKLRLKKETIVSLSDHEQRDIKGGYNTAGCGAGYDTAMCPSVNNFDCGGNTNWCGGGGGGDTMYCGYPSSDCPIETGTIACQTWNKPLWTIGFC
jgi:natural product precursor